MKTLCFLSADPSLGRIDKHSLSQETLMELLISNFNNTKRICGSHESPKDVSEWKGVEFDDTNEIITIFWYALSLGGSIELKWLPSSLKRFKASRNRLSGTADFTRLPAQMEFLALSRNRFEGTIDLTKLPETLEKLFLYRNNFCGFTDFSKLPKALVKLDISDTQLEGEVFEFHGLLEISDSKVKDMRKK